MNEFAMIGGIALVVSIAGCAPLQQAPLVYSSKVVVGVDVSANLAENQGGSVNIGVKTVDSAYVPVAVSKEIDKRAPDTDKTLELRLIEARYGEGESADKSDEASVAERNKKIDAYFAARQSADQAATAKNNLESTISNLSSFILGLNSLKTGIVNANNLSAAPAASASGVAQQNPRIDALRQQSENLKKFLSERKVSIVLLTVQDDGASNVAEVINDIDASIAAASSEKSIAEKQLPSIKDQDRDKAEAAAKAKIEAAKVAGLYQTSKTDAMSVYGRFDSNTNGSATEKNASLLIGKVFSTGLASQNLTEAVKLEARSRCLDAGFQAAKGYPSGVERESFLDRLTKICGLQPADLVKK